MTDHALDRAELAEAVGNDIATWLTFGCCGSFNSWSRRANSSRSLSTRGSAIALSFAKRNHGLQHGVYRLAAV